MVNLYKRWDKISDQSSTTQNHMTVSFLSHPVWYFDFVITKLAFHSVCNSTVHFKTLIFHHEHFYFHSWKVAILKILVCTMNPKPCCSGWNFPIIILHGISTIEVNWFNPKLLFDLPRKLFTILELSRRFILFTIFLAQLLTTLKIHFDIQL